MAKIDPLAGSIAASHNLPVRKKNKKIKKEKSSFFSDILKSSKTDENSTIRGEQIGSSSEISREELSELIDEMFDLGKIMSSTQSMKDLLNYKKSVKKFLSFFVRNSMETRQVTSKSMSFLTRNGGAKQYTTLNIIDTKLENLAAAVLSNHLGNLEILKKVDEIQGLMVDLIA